MKFGLQPGIHKQINTIFEKYPEINKVILYGSRALGTYRNGSDIDLTIVGEDIALQKIIRILSDLDDLDLPYSFDLSAYDKIQNPELLDHIKRVGKIFYIKTTLQRK